MEIALVSHISFENKTCPKIDYIGGGIYQPKGIYLKYMDNKYFFETKNMFDVGKYLSYPNGKFILFFNSHNFDEFFNISWWSFPKISTNFYLFPTVKDCSES